jgi:hypothetical protein
MRFSLFRLYCPSDNAGLWFIVLAHEPAAALFIASSSELTQLTAHRTSMW